MSFGNSVMVPIIKASDSTLVNNYRPVSQECGFAVVFKKVVHQHVYFRSNSTIPEVQHCFLKGRLVESNLTKVP